MFYNFHRMNHRKNGVISYFIELSLSISTKKLNIYLAIFLGFECTKNGQNPFIRNFIFPRPCGEFLDILAQFFSIILHSPVKMIKVQDWIKKEKNNRTKVIHKKFSTSVRMM